MIDKVRVGLLSLALAYGVLWLAASLFGEQSFPIWAIVVTYGFATLAELLLWTISLAYVTRISPPQVAGAVMGSWYIALAAGSALGG